MLIVFSAVCWERLPSSGPLKEQANITDKDFSRAEFRSPSFTNVCKIWRNNNNLCDLEPFICDTKYCLRTKPAKTIAKKKKTSSWKWSLTNMNTWNHSWIQNPKRQQLNWSNNWTALSSNEKRLTDNVQQRSF